MPPAPRQPPRRRAGHPRAAGLALGLALASGLSLAQAPSPAQATPAAASPAAANPALARAVAEPGAVLTDSGMVYRSLREGTGEAPTATDTVRVHYRGTFPDGREFDSSFSRGQPASFPLNRVIRCWTEGLQRMKPGGKARLACPPALAYGERGAGGGAIPPNSTLLFEVELLGVERR